MYAAAMSGKPMVVVPVLMDQFVHSELVNQKQIGVGSARWMLGGS